MSKNLKVTDGFIIVIMMLIAGCGLIYEYAISHFAARVIGSMEIVIYSIISIMIVSMGVGAFLAKKIKDPFVSFSILESLIAIIAVIGIFLISGANTLAYELPNIIAKTYNISYDMSLKGGLLNTFELILSSTSFIIAGILGVLIGMEIPLMARIRESVHKKHLEHNAGMIYGADYIGAGLGAAVWIFVLLRMEISTSIAIVTATNVFSGFLFIAYFYKHIKKLKLVLSIQVVSIFIIYFGCLNMVHWQDYLEDSLYKDPIVYSTNTKYQRIAITKAHDYVDNKDYYNFFINGRTQFSENDEVIYHSLLTAPAILSSGDLKDVLVIGGGDGLAVRDILKYNPKSITLLDLDEEIIKLFKEPLYVEGKQINKSLLELNKYSFSDKRLNFILGDAFLNVRNLMRARKKFSTIIIDLPDPSHPDLNKMYSKEFYKRLHYLLEENGSMIAQSTSPYNAYKAFLSIKKTMKAAGFKNVEQLHENVPSFGQWGWTIANKDQKSPSEKLKEINKNDIKSNWLTKDILLSSFEFGKNFYRHYDNIEVNRLGTGVTYNYYQNAWKNSILFNIE
tara:strand:- start:31784 stop:33475 length:1692 start_codon:yes stop_codon:yes gene_type:complete